MLQAIYELGHTGEYGSGVHDDESDGFLLFPFVEQGCKVRQRLFPGTHQIDIRAEVLSGSLPFAGIEVGDFEITEKGLVDSGQLVDFQPRKLVLNPCEAKKDIFRSGDGALRQIGGKSRRRADANDA